MPDTAWKYLYEIYDGTDIPRYSIEAATDEDDNNGGDDKQYIVEVFY